MEVEVKFRVYYRKCGTDRIDSSIAVGVNGSGKKAYLVMENGGWNPAADSFFTEAQCRHYHKMPPKDWEAVNLKVAARLDKMAEQIRRSR